MNLKIPLAKTLDHPTTLAGQYRLKVLFDTGAMLPVWSRSIDYLKHVFPTCRELKQPCKLQGFNSSAMKGKVYEIPEFRLRGYNGTVVLKNLPVACYKGSTSYDLVLSYTVFGNTKLLFNPKNYELIIMDYERPIMCRCRDIDINGEYITVAARSC